MSPRPDGKIDDVVGTSSRARTLVVGYPELAVVLAAGIALRAGIAPVPGRGRRPAC
jgi:hypothetical protein